MAPVRIPMDDKRQAFAGAHDPEQQCGETQNRQVADDDCAGGSRIRGERAVEECHRRYGEEREQQAGERPAARRGLRHGHACYTFETMWKRRD